MATMRSWIPYVRSHATGGAASRDRAGAPARGATRSNLRNRDALKYEAPFPPPAQSLACPTHSVTLSHSRCSRVSFLQSYPAVVMRAVEAHERAAQHQELPPTPVTRLSFCGRRHIAVGSRAVAQPRACRARLVRGRGRRLHTLALEAL